jgi:hypothetical protein
MSASSPLPSFFSSPASSRPTRRASFSGQLAFLVHSQETVANHMPPDVDNKALARQKRRRTRYVFSSGTNSFHLMFDALETNLERATGAISASVYPTKATPPTSTLHRLTTRSCSKEDEDVLKAEYLINPKPDKTARLEIVTKVALGEKEVQVQYCSTSRVCAPLLTSRLDLVPE